MIRAQKSLVTFFRTDYIREVKRHQKQQSLQRLHAGKTRVPKAIVFHNKENITNEPWHTLGPWSIFGEPVLRNVEQRP